MLTCKIIPFDLKTIRLLDFVLFKVLFLSLSITCNKANQKVLFKFSDFFPIHYLKDENMKYSTNEQNC